MFFCIENEALLAQLNRRISAKPAFVYPAGGQQGTTCEVWVAGRNLSRTTGAIVSGDGVTIRIIDNQRLYLNLDQRDRYMIRDRIANALTTLVAETPEGKLVKDLLDRIPKINKPPDPPEEIEAIPFVWPRNVVLRKLAEPDSYVPMNEMLDIVYQTYGPNAGRRPPDVMHEVAVLEVEIASNAEPGDRELRLITNQGLTNPMYFQIGQYPEAMECEPNCRDVHGVSQVLAKFPQPVFELPIVLNGRILHSDIDRFQFRAKKGESLVLYAQARQLMPYLADAVPGWFEAVLTIFDTKGREIAYSDCFRFEADPVLYFDPPEDGIYTVEIRDSLFRGREDFVYRLTIASMPIVESVFPLGLREGSTATLQIRGRNLPATEISVHAAPGSETIRSLSKINDVWLPKPILYQVDQLPEIMPSETMQDATDDSQAVTLPNKEQTVTWPCVINGRIASPGQNDFYRVEGKEGEPVVIEILARRLNSPLDSRIALFGPDGKLIAENDDGKTIDENRNYVSDLIGLQTHNADSKLSVTFPKTGIYTLRIGDALRQGGEAFGYRLRISRPRPEFDVYTTPSARLFNAGNNNQIWFAVERKDGFDGPIELKISGDAQGCRLDGGLIQPGETEVVATLSTPSDPLKKPLALRFEAVAQNLAFSTASPVAAESPPVRRPVHAVEDMEQAFLYHHWVPTQDFRILMNSRQGSTHFRPLNAPVPLVLKQGQSIDIEFETPNGWVPSTLIIYPKDAPPGVLVRKKSLKKVEGKNRLILTFSAATDALLQAAKKEQAAGTSKPIEGENKDGEQSKAKPTVEPKPYLAGNMQIFVDAESEPKKSEEKPNTKPTRYSLGQLPAIPYRIVP